MNKRFDSVAAGKSHRKRHGAGGVKVLDWPGLLFRAVGVCLAARERIKLGVSAEVDERWMRRALQLAERAEEQGEVPVGALVVRGDDVIAEGWNCPVGSHDASAHAEIVAMRAAGATLGNYRLLDTTLYVTLEPCAMCVGAIVHARVARVVYGASDPKAGAVHSVMTLPDATHFNHHPVYTGGVLATECGGRLREFFRRRR